MRPKLLFLAQILPYPLHSGPQLRAYYVLRHLAKHYRITLVCFIRNEEQLQWVPQLSPFCESIHPLTRDNSILQEGWALCNSLVSGKPFMVVRHHRKSMRNLIHDVLSEERVDLVHIDQLIMGQYLDLFDGIPVLIDKHNAYAEIVRGVGNSMGSGLHRILARVEWPKLKRFESHLCKQCDAIVTVTAQDARLLDDWAGTPLNSTVIPICTDPGEVVPFERPMDAKDIISVGSLFYPPNVDGALWFGQQVYPRIAPALENSQTWLIGGRPVRTLQLMARKTPGLHLPGFVADLTPYLEKSTVFIVPLRYGSGMRVKILDALAWGIPVVSTSIGAQGIDVVPGESILIADDPVDFADAILRVIRDRSLADRLSHHGRRLIQSHYDWKVVYQRFDPVYHELLDTPT